MFNKFYRILSYLFHLQKILMEISLKSYLMKKIERLITKKKSKFKFT